MEISYKQWKVLEQYMFPFITENKFGYHIQVKMVYQYIIYIKYI